MITLETFVYARKFFFRRTMAMRSQKIEGPMTLYRGLSRRYVPTKNYQINERIRILEQLSSMSSYRSENATRDGKNNLAQVNRTAATEKHTMYLPCKRNSKNNRRFDPSYSPKRNVKMNHAIILTTLKRNTDYIWHPGCRNIS